MSSYVTSDGDYDAPYLEDEDQTSGETTCGNEESCDEVEYLDETEDESNEPKPQSIEDTNIKLIESVEFHKHLYDLSSDEHRKKDKRTSAWTDIISSILDIPPSDVTPKLILEWQRKWKNIRTSYVRHKREARGKSGQSASATKPYKYSAFLSFLDPYISTEKTLVTPNSGTNPDDTASSSQRQGNLITIT